MKQPQVDVAAFLQYGLIVYSPQIPQTTRYLQHAKKTTY
jgi:hypothetical protein